MPMPLILRVFSIAVAVALLAVAASSQAAPNSDSTHGVLVSGRLTTSDDLSDPQPAGPEAGDRSQVVGADLVVFVHEGQGSGTVDGVPFGVKSPVAFVITAAADLANRVDISTGFSLQHSTASITIDGVGTLQFVTPTRTFVNNELDLVGFSRADGSDLFNGPQDASFGTWDMTTSIGPIAGTGSLLQWDSVVETDAGVLEFDDGPSPAIFTAVPAVVFADGFESGDTSAWSSAVP